MGEKWGSQWVSLFRGLVKEGRQQRKATVANPTQQGCWQSPPCTSCGEGLSAHAPTAGWQGFGVCSKGLGEKGRGTALCKPLSLLRSNRGCSEEKPWASEPYLGCSKGLQSVQALGESGRAHTVQVFPFQVSQLTTCTQLGEKSHLLLNQR